MILNVWPLTISISDIHRDTYELRTIYDSSKYASVLGRIWVMGFHHLVSDLKVKSYLYFWMVEVDGVGVTVSNQHALILAPAVWPPDEASREAFITAHHGWPIMLAAQGQKLPIQTAHISLELSMPEEPVLTEERMLDQLVLSIIKAEWRE